MPPRRGRGGRSGGTPAPPDPSPRAQRTPGPSRLSTAYGSPAQLAPSRAALQSSYDGMGNALRSVQEDNPDAQRGRGSQRNRSSAAPPASPPANSPAKLPTVPPALPHQQVQPPPRPADNNNAPLGGRAATVQPDGNISRSYRFMSAPVHSDTPSHRSFIEETELYQHANVGTPRAPNPPRHTPNSPATVASHSGSSSIDDNDDEDPLHRGTPGGSRVGRDTVTTPRPPPSYRPISWADRFTQSGGFGGTAAKPPLDITGTPTRDNSGAPGLAPAGGLPTPTAITDAKALMEALSKVLMEASRAMGPFSKVLMEAPRAMGPFSKGIAESRKDLKALREHPDSPGYPDYKDSQDHKGTRGLGGRRGRRDRQDQQGRQGQQGQQGQPD
ncbi:hypothetical protein DHEL01_v207670 [Diaporthe helianthi]|uniref:Uncharacterized protein n=1 Tax=Diaporthe helianthi TaxID=158607 RepID=A0A2P5HUM2_DIAHE|nr:hypothetical protein DHEL01_v207670 [Diaporthe helianthi]